MAHSMKILLVKMSSLGDVISNLPLVTDIKHHFPDSQIDWVVEERIRDIPAWHSDVNHIYSIALRRWKKNLFKGESWAEFREFRREIKKEKYDYILDTQGLLKSVYVARLANGQSHGLDSKTARESLAGLFYHHTHNIPRHLHAVTRNRSMGALSLGYEIDQSSFDYGISGPVLSDNFSWLPNDYVVCFHGTARAAKKWPADRWVDLGNRLIQDGLVPVFAWGSDDEYQEVLELSDRIVGSLVPPGPRLNVPQSAFLVDQAKAIVGVDTGFVHLSAALNKPTVGIYVDSDPARNGALAGSRGAAMNIGTIGNAPNCDQVIRALSEVMRT